MNMRPPRSLLFGILAAASCALLTAASASAHTICRPDGICFNTSGDPIAPWQQPAFRGGFADDGGYSYDRPYPYRYYRHHHRHWRYHEED
jgi:hypothetical protein